MADRPWGLATALPLALAVLLPIDARACPGDFNPQPPASCTSLGPELQCALKGGACTSDEECCDVKCAPGDLQCPAPEDRDVCVRWPFIDRNADGCFDPGDTPFTFGDIYDQCQRALGSDAGCSTVGTRTTCCHPDRALPICCTHDSAKGALPEYRIDIQVVAPAGLTTPADLKCRDGTSLFNPPGSKKRCTRHPARECRRDTDCRPPRCRNCGVDETCEQLLAARTSIYVDAGSAFRNYAWGMWKNHLPQTRLFVQAANVVLGGYDVRPWHCSGHTTLVCQKDGDCRPPRCRDCVGETCTPPDNPAYRDAVQMNWDQDVQITATNGCIVGGPYAGSRPNNTVRVNGPGDSSRDAVLLLRAFSPAPRTAASPPASVGLQPGAWDLEGKLGLVKLEGCPVAVKDSDINVTRANPNLPEIDQCPRCTGAGHAPQRYCHVAGSGWTGCAMASCTCTQDADCNPNTTFPSRIRHGLIAFFRRLAGRGVLGPVVATCEERPCRIPGKETAIGFPVPDDCPAPGDSCAPSAAPGRTVSLP